jgi:hypothetical protein
MSEHLVRELDAAQNVTVEPNVEIADAQGDGWLRSVTP